MILRGVFWVSILVALSAAAPTTPDANNLERVLDNLTALWDEVHYLQRELDFHLHDGQSDTNGNLDQILEEVNLLAHEHHVHHIGHPHEGHNQHHNGELLQHLETSHGHGDHKHVNGGVRSGHRSRDRHGGHRNRGGHDDDSDEQDFNSEEDTNRRSGGKNQDRAHEEDSSEESEHHIVQDDTHDFHGIDKIKTEHIKQDAQFYEQDHYSADAQSHRSQQSHKHHRKNVQPHPGYFVDTWMHASCELEPNSNLPSQVKGKVDISQRLDRRGGVFFDVDIDGFDVAQSGRMYGVHIHENAIQGQNCNGAGGYNRLFPAAIQNPSRVGNSYAGNIGDLTVNADGELDNVISTSIDVTFDEIMGKSIVVHSLGLGDPASIVYKVRLACCNIKQLPNTSARSKKSGRGRSHGRHGHH